MRQLIIATTALLLSVIPSVAEEPVITPADGVFPLTGIYSLVPHTPPNPNMPEAVAGALLQGNCTSPTVFAANGVGMSFITVMRKSGRIASLQRLQKCTIEDGIMSCRSARRRGNVWSVEENQTARTWRLARSDDERNLLCGPENGIAPPDGAACYSLNLCSTEIGAIPVARTKGSTIAIMRDRPPLE
ncbi:hypothetical protein [Ahrensia sp. R2A130]|uniref:hypothetical protein n=1 Tax=Ahrensia sp. R2A130 TaxID=744979 RepID=UPI0001E0A4D9|nr:hypothetical protein [Ahrensia sp. R2A130]EFL88230.1 hypothetical protein R2A130_2049 [Ahrensia sp. R2A130]